MRRINYWVVAAALLLSPLLHADEEIEEWYTSKGGEYLVKDSVHGNLYALLSNSQSGEPSVYIIMYDEDCKDQSDDIISHNPLYVNGVLTRYQQYCDSDDERRYFLPATEAGRSNLVKEFKEKKFVEIKSHNDDFNFIFTGQGFTALYDLMVLQNSGI